MATGFLRADSLVAAAPAVVASEAELPPVTGVLFGGNAPGAFTEVLAEPLSATKTGVVTREFFDDFYNRIHITPPFYSFGLVTADASATVRVWNANLRSSVTLTGITTPSGAGVTVSGPAVPYLLSPLAVATYTVEVSQNGLPAFDGDITFSFGSEGPLRMRASGIRARLWVAPPNWSGGYKVTYAFKTEILPSASGKEQRSALRRTPRKTIEYAATLAGDDLRDAKGKLWGRQHLSFVLPEEPRFARLAADALAGDFTVTLDAAPAWLVAGGMLVLVGDSGAEMLPIESVSGSVVTTKTAVGAGWGAGTRAHYGIGGNMAASLSSTRPASRVGELSIVFNCTPASEAFDAGLGTTFEEFDGAPVFLKKPNWTSAPAITSAHDVTEVDFDRGAVARFTPIAFGRETRQATYVGRNFVEAEAIRDLFFRCRGQRGVFWAPTWEFDIVPAETVPSGSSALNVAGWDLHENYADSTVHGAVFVKWADGEVDYRRIAAIDQVTSGGSKLSSITLASAFSRPIDPGADMVGWLYLCRFATDQLTIEWVTRSVAQTQIQFTTVEVEPNLADLL